jgi:hypothetical protein
MTPNEVTPVDSGWRALLAGGASRSAATEFNR